MTFEATLEQQEIFRAARETRKNLMIEADAGCGKTSTMVLLSQNIPIQPALALAFNKKIAEELTRVMPGHFTIKTMHGLGFSALMKAKWASGVKFTISDRKIASIVTGIFKEAKHEGPEEDWIIVRDWIVRARGAGMVPSAYAQTFGQGLILDIPEQWDQFSDEIEPQEILRDFAREGLRRAMRQTLEDRVIDFDDMIYASLFMGGIYPKPPLIIGDEVQDWNPLNRLQIERCGPQARLFLVGDSKQAIYAFRGADSQSMRNLRGLRPVDSWMELGLHLTFRCPKIVVERQRGHAPKFTAFHTNAQGMELDWRRSPQKIVGVAEDPPKIEFGGVKHDGWSYEWLKSLREKPSDRVAILCRNNAPLLELAFKLIRRGIGPTMLGRDIGAGIKRLAIKISGDKPEMELSAFKDALASWRSNEITKAELMDKQHMISGIEDRAECLRAVMENATVRTVGDLGKALDAIFVREFGECTLATGHKAKGLEWEIVVMLDPWRIPSRFAQSDPGQMMQEMNLKYVMETRTKRVFVEANLEDFI